MKLAIYRLALVVFIAALLPCVLPGGRHEAMRAAFRRIEPLNTYTDDPVLQTNAQEQNQPQRPGKQQGGGAVIRFIRDPDAAPEFAVKGIDGGTVNLTAARGKVVLLNFWATWCGPCRMEVPIWWSCKRNIRTGCR